MMFVIIMRVDEEKEVFENLERRLLSTKSLFDNPDVSIQLFKFFHGRLVAVVNSVFCQFGSLETPTGFNIATRGEIIFDAFSASAGKVRFWLATNKEQKSCVLWTQK